VFPASADLSIRHEDDRLVGPGIGDNSLSVAALLTLPRILDQARIQTGSDLLLCANTGEEGLGNLRGMRHAVATYRDDLTAVIVLEGHHLGRVYNHAVGSRRLRVTVTAPGGHSWGAFGNASAIHVLGEMIAAIAKLPVPVEPKTTFNVGMIDGGVSINTIAPRATLTLDLRSVDPASLTHLISRVEAIMEEANDVARGISVRSEIVGDRPGGVISADTPIIRTTLDTLQELGLDPQLSAGSTDANIPIAEGIPAICIGLTTGNTRIALTNTSTFHPSDRTEATGASRCTCGIGDGLEGEPFFCWEKATHEEKVAIDSGAPRQFGISDNWQNRHNMHNEGDDGAGASIALEDGILFRWILCRTEPF
jgi:acetylornithine deacetylase/succinyl-diaminopimelate desuccinylase-like protein